MHLRKAMPPSSEVLYYTGRPNSGSNYSDDTGGYVVASTTYVDDTLHAILDPLEPLEPAEASIGTYWIVGEDALLNRREIEIVDKPYIDKLGYVTLANAKLYTTDEIKAFEDRYTPYIESYVKSYTNCHVSKTSEFLIKDSVSRIDNHFSFLESEFYEKIKDNTDILEKWVQDDFQVPTINRINNWQQDILDFIKPIKPCQQIYLYHHYLIYK